MLSEAVIEAIKEFVSEENVKVNASLSEYTSFKIGGPAEAVIDISNEQQLMRVINYLKMVEIDYCILGNGSNTLFADAGFQGVVLRIGNKFSDVSVRGDEIIAQGGALLVQVAKMAQANGLSGLEFAAGIPGTVGGGVIMNAGAYDGEMSYVVKQVRAISPKGDVQEFDGEALDFGYRKSVLKNSGFIVTEVVFKLAYGDSEEILAKMNDFNARRREKQPLEYPSAGSTFKRPEGYYAGQLIMEAGLRGFQIGGARVSDKHCGFIINVNKASAADVCDLIGEVQARVKARFGVDLEPEIVIIR